MPPLPPVLLTALAAALLPQGVPLEGGASPQPVLTASGGQTTAPPQPRAADNTPPPTAAGGEALPSAVDPGAAVQRELVLDRRRRQLAVLQNGRPLRRFPVAVGMPGWETPVGRFQVLEMRRDPTWEHPASGVRIPPGPANPLGSRWIGFHRDCRGRSGFNGQEHLVVRGCVVAGFHGTPQRDSVGRAVSHGCVRLFEEHVRELFELVQVGTPVTVLP